MRIAIIDLGTNSVRFDVHEITGKNRYRLMHREKLMVRLGQELFVTGRLNPDAITRTLLAFKSFHEKSVSLKVSKVVAFATSALREASDRNVLLEKIQKKTGIRVRVISGPEEARLIAEGILANEKNIPRNFALIDIGGGSTEITLCSRKKVVFGQSYPLGTARLQQLFLKRSPPSGKNIEALRALIRDALSGNTLAKKKNAISTIVGSSGTIKALDRILRKGYHLKFNFENLTNLVAKMSVMNTGQLLSLPGMEARRVDMILAGGILLEESMRALNAKEVRSTTFSLRDGVLQKELLLVGKNKTTHLGLHLAEVCEKAVALGGDRESLQSLMKLSSNLFDRLSRVHKMKPEWKPYLEAAVALRNSGYFISHFNSEFHSEYVIRNLDFPSIETWELELIATLCFNLRNDKIEMKRFSLDARKVKEDVFLKLLSLLQIVNAFDTGQKKISTVKKITIRKKGILISIAKKTTHGLEIPQIEQNKKLFERVFKKTILAKAE